jgi:hypothetical protein
VSIAYFKNKLLFWLYHSLKILLNVLKKDKYVIINTPNKEDLSKSIIMCPKCKRNFHKTGHCQVFTEKRLENLLEKQNFKVIKMKTLYLNLYSNSKALADLLYWFKIDKFVSDYNNDIFLVAKKIIN